MKHLVSLTNRTYYGRPRRAGQHFRASDAHARMLIAAGFAREAPPPAPNGGAMPEPERPKRAYRRRDLEAERLREDE